MAKIDKEIIDNLNNIDKLLLLRTTSNNKAFYRDVCSGKTLIENIRLELHTESTEIFFPNKTIYDKNGKTREVPYQIKIMLYTKITSEYDPRFKKQIIEKWVWVNSVDNHNWDWFYGTYYLLTNKHYTAEELYVMSEEDTINNHKIHTRNNIISSLLS
jgi:hypothetical protein